MTNKRDESRETKQETQEMERGDIKKAMNSKYYYTVKYDTEQGKEGNLIEGGRRREVIKQ